MIVYEEKKMRINGGKLMNKNRKVFLPKSAMKICHKLNIIKSDL